MRSEKEIWAKYKKLRKKLRRSIFEYGQSRRQENCVFWLDKVEGDSKCVFPVLNNSEQGYRECSSAGTCRDFKCRFNSDDLNAKFLKVVNDPDYLARNYRDLFILDWVLQEPKPNRFQLWLEKYFMWS